MRDSTVHDMVLSGRALSDCVDLLTDLELNDHLKQTRDLYLSFNRRAE